jgi:hypothetical protein
MPMMRRGPLDRYPVEWVLRQAYAHRISGSVEFHVGEPVTVYLDEGRVYAAAPGTGAGAAEWADPEAETEVEARRRTISLLSHAIHAGDGWYFLDPFGHRPTNGTWTWELATLLMEVRSKAHEGDTLGAWSSRTIGLQETEGSQVTLTADAWAVVAALAGTASAATLRERTGWSPSRLSQALSEIEQVGVLDPGAAWRPTTADGSSAAVPPAGTAGGAVAGATAGPATDGHHRGPLAPPPPMATDADASARRPRRLGRRATGS